MQWQWNNSSLDKLLFKHKSFIVCPLKIEGDHENSSQRCILVLLTRSNIWGAAGSKVAIRLSWLVSASPWQLMLKNHAVIQ